VVSSSKPDGESGGDNGLSVTALLPLLLGKTKDLFVCRVREGEIKKENTLSYDWVVAFVVVAVVAGGMLS